MKKYTLILILFISVLSACNKAADVNGNPAPPVTTATKIAPDGFNYATERLVSYSIKLQTNFNKPISGVMVPARASSS